MVVNTLQGQEISVDASALGLLLDYIDDDGALATAEIMIVDPYCSYFSFAVELPGSDTADDYRSVYEASQDRRWLYREEDSERIDWFWVAADKIQFIHTR